MRISIITVSKNAERFIERAIKSVVSQTYEDIEYIIIDGNSQDKTKEIAHKYSDQISRFISEPDGGIYEAMNKGIRYSSGEFIGFINSDDYYFDDKVIENTVNFLLANPSCDFVYGDLEVREQSGSTILVKPPMPEDVADELICGCLPHQASFSRANLFFSKIGLFNERYRISSDYEWFLRLIQNETVKLCYYPRTMTSYYAGGISSQLRLSLPESYSIQNQCPMYQDSYWLNRRILKYQEFVINLREWLQNSESGKNALNINYTALENKYQAVETEYNALKLELEQARAKIAEIAKIVEKETGINQNGQSANIKLNLTNLEQV